MTYDQERTHRARGGRRLHARITGEAHDALALLCAHHGLDQRQVVEALLLAAGAKLLREDDDAALLRTMRDHRMSRPEAEFFRSLTNGSDLLKAVHR